MNRNDTVVDVIVDASIQTSHTFPDGSNIPCFSSIFYSGSWEVSSNSTVVIQNWFSHSFFPALLMGIGCYAVVDKWASGEGFRLENVFDIIFNLAFLLIIIGGIVFIVSTILFQTRYQKKSSFHFWFVWWRTKTSFNEKIPLFIKRLVILKSKIFIFRSASQAVLVPWEKICASSNSIPCVYYYSS